VGHDADVPGALEWDLAGHDVGRSSEHYQR
jgi:hypothetical protein